MRLFLCLTKGNFSEKKFPSVRLIFFTLVRLIFPSSEKGKKEREKGKRKRKVREYKKKRERERERK